MPAISLCIPCYNVSKYLPKLFESIKKQKFDSFDVIFLNDGSTDNTLELLENFKKEFDSIHPVHIYTQKNKGLASARNELIKYADGDYIFFLDSDDELCKGCLSSLYKKSNNGTKDIVRGRSIVIYKEWIKLPLIHVSGYSFNNNKSFFKNRACFAWGMLIKKEIAKELKCLEGYCYEDTFFNSLFLKTNNVAFSNKNIYKYYRRSNTLSHYSNSNKWKLVDCYHQIIYALEYYKKQGLLNTPSDIKLVGTQLPYFLFPSASLCKFYSNNKLINYLPLLPYAKLFLDIGFDYKFKFHVWKMAIYKRIHCLYKVCVKIIKNQDRNPILDKLNFLDIANFNKKTKSNSIYLVDDWKQHEQLIKDNKNKTFFVYDNECQLMNTCNGIKPTKIDQSLLENEKVFFIDLRDIKTFSEKEIDIINNINLRILVLLPLSQKDSFSSNYNKVFM